VGILSLLGALRSGAQPGAKTSEQKPQPGIAASHESESRIVDVKQKPLKDGAIKAYREGTLPFPDGTVLCPARLGLTSRRRKTTQSLAVPNLPIPGPPRIRTFSSWSRTQHSTPRRAAGGSLNSITTAHLPTRRRSKPAFPATRLSTLATWCSPLTHLATENHSRKE
jgi:hypothetical protein